MEPIFTQKKFRPQPPKHPIEAFFARIGKKIRKILTKIKKNIPKKGRRKYPTQYETLNADVHKQPIRGTGSFLEIEHTQQTQQSPFQSFMQKISRFKKRKKRRRRQKTWKWWFFRTLKWFSIFTIIGLIALIGVFIYFSKDLPEVGKVNSRFVAESTKIYDRSGKILLYDIHGEEKRTIIPGSQIPITIKHATIALEDHDFYNHHGIRFKAIMRAVASQVFGFGTPSGGSTITQQLIKNSILTSERSITRKIKEAILAVELEFTSTKEEILELYLNEIPYGSNAYGIEAAANTFFDKNARDLSYDEAAILAALPQAPSRYSPYGLNQELLKGRQERAIDEMVNLGFINQNQGEEYKKIDVLAKIAKNREAINAPHFVFYVRDYLEEKYGADYLEKNGLTVITTLDWEKQEIAQRITKEKALENKEKYNAENASLVAINPSSGEILTMVGSRDYFDEEIDGQVNVALSKRQPGSSFKPYVYLQSFREGYTPETIYYDVETAFPVDRADDYEPQNYDGKFNGPVKAKEALAMSLNIPAVKALYLVGLNDVLTFTKNLGISTLTNPKRYGLSLVLGGGEVTLLDHTAAFSVLANGGEKHEKVAILEVKDRNGELLEKYTKNKPERIVKKEYVDLLSHILSTNEYRIPAFGENNPLRFDDRPVAAKTGTTNENRDAWTMGYTPEVAIGVWSGNNDNSSMNNKGVGANVAAPIFRAFLLEAYPEKGTDSFAQYNKKEVRTGKDILDGNIPEIEKIDVCEISKKDEVYCKENKYCPNGSKKERAFFDLHNILHFVKKDDPRGVAPKNPQEDPSYENWEKGVKEYYKDQDDVIFAKEPRACQAGDFGSVKPEISLKIKVSKDELEVKVDDKAAYDIKEYQYIINGSEVAKFDGDRYIYKIPNDKKGATLKIDVKVIDELGNTAQATAEAKIPL